MLNHAESADVTPVVVIDLTFSASDGGATRSQNVGEPHVPPTPLNVAEVGTLLEEHDDARGEVIFDPPVRHVARMLAEGLPPAETSEVWQDFVEQLLALQGKYWNRVVLTESQGPDEAEPEAVLLLAAAQLLDAPHARRLTKELRITARRPAETLKTADLVAQVVEVHQLQQDQRQAAIDSFTEEKKKVKAELKAAQRSIKYFESKLETLRNARDKRDRKIEELQESQKTQQETLVAQRARLQDLDIDRQRLLRKLETEVTLRKRSEQKVEGLRLARSNRNQHIEQLQEELRAAQAENERLTSSRSWRYTKVLRK